MGAVPRDWMEEFGMEQCLHCSSLISKRFGGKDNVFCPKCAHARRYKKTTRTAHRAAHPTAPDMEEACMAFSEAVDAWKEAWACEDDFIAHVHVFIDGTPHWILPYYALALDIALHHEVEFGRD